jgi:microcin C transport system substrate-binding protein
MAFTRRSFTKLAFAAPLLPWMKLSAQAQERQFRHGVTLFEKVKYGPDFKNFDYVNPDAPKGGKLRYGLLGSFDSLNPFTEKGDSIDPNVNEALLVGSLDEPSSAYGLLAEGVWYPDDFSEAIYRLRPEARFHDGKPVTPEDVIFSFESQKENRPRSAAYYKNILKLEQVGERDVRLVFSEKGNRELPQIAGQLVIAPKHWWLGKDASGKQRDISAPTLEPILGSGPYKLIDIKSGASFTQGRIEDYWGKDLAVNRGRNNFDFGEVQLYTDSTVLLEAFKGDQFDIQRESSSKQWATGYDFPAVKDGRCLKEEIPRLGVQGMQSWAPNLRREKFQDARVRQALNLAFDFEWSNQNLFFSQYIRSRSYFNNSELEAKGLPSPEELAILEPLKDKLPPEVFTTEFANPLNTTPQDRRKNLRTAQKLLADAGWTSSSEGTKRILKNAKGETLSLDFLLYSPTFERIALPYKEQLELLGFDVTIRTVDVAQYQQLVKDFNFDIIVGSWGQSLSPGNEQREFFGSEFADKTGSRNYCGIKNPAIDKIIDTVIAAPNRQALIAATHALDRALISNSYVVPMWYYPFERVAYWKRVKHPQNMPGYDLGYPSIWWFDAAADAELKKA